MKENITIDEQLRSIKLDGINYYLKFDMNSFRVFKRLSGQSLLMHVRRLYEFDDDIILALFGAIMRTEEDGEPIGEKVMELDTTGLLLQYFEYALNTVADAFPKEENKTNNNKKK